ncbi:4-hydroxythreonine-4-phosphate dehydrogenase PdxA [Maritalea mediterranea]|uniref:4-hydroxythreonine-4-phosphate dehydrogenase n=1 Tax=Maritalea mediterranea TaxID=2909667 RepID=A0ABS9E7C2_9HYPH|nr:4-hydroxythreonine-4-phosphate dehydrogenase PdxA [Maritalea mediterranea]MCF4098092.1 4-hydroxythreonine-4-phosphate dehydrogenase PdxA [Maritalea mediterranea]
MPSPLAISIGEPAGIGPDLILKIYKERVAQKLPVFCVFGDPDLLDARAKRLGYDLAIKTTTPGQAPEIFDHALPVVDLGHRVVDQPGILSPDAAPLVVDAIRQSVDAIFAGQCRGLVTAPIHKANLYKEGFDFPGHTEYLASLCAKGGDTLTPIMMLAHGSRRAVPVTIHMALKQVFETLTPDLIIENVRIVYRDLQTRFRIERPQIGVTGLNPHAGEDGTMGKEEIDIIAPALQRLRVEGFPVDGPLPADTAFAPHIWSNYDALIAMYHDQALIPVKAIGFDEGVNITLGLPIVRTSPDHGTALTLAGTGKASPNSFLKALAIADEMTQKPLT